MTNILSKPVNVSLTMANDSLLKTLLFEEPQQLDNAAYTDTIAQYLQAYQSKYGYDSVFLVSPPPRGITISAALTGCWSGETLKMSGITTGCCRRKRNLP